MAALWRCWAKRSATEEAGNLLLVLFCLNLEYLVLVGLAVGLVFGTPISGWQLDLFPV